MSGRAPERGLPAGDFRWTDHEVRAALGLRTGAARDDVVYPRISTDSRAAARGDLYVALKGERFDGHAFVADAVASGARGAVVSHPAPGARDVILYPVADTLRALGDLAAHRRAAIGATVVAVTGSSGKTATKDFLAAAIGGTHRTHATSGNKNNRVGVPLTLLDAPLDAEVVVLELGTSEPGEIRALTAIAGPDVAVITTVGESHLEGLGSLEGVLEEKLDLLRGLAAEGHAVVGDRPPELAERAREIRADVRVAGSTERADPDARPDDVRVDEAGRHTFRWRGLTVTVPVPGRHAVDDALLALTVAELLGVPAEDAVRGIAGARPASLRGEVRRVGGLTLLVDCYNANPQSTRAALEALELHRTAPRRVAVLGTMLELGGASDRLHDEVLRDALARDIEMVVATGGFEAAARRVVADDVRVLAAADWASAYPALRERLHGDEILLLKASRGVAMEGIIPLLERDYAAAGPGEER